MNGVSRPEFATVPQLAESLGIPAWRVRRLWEDGTISKPATKLGTTFVLNRAEIALVVSELTARGWLKPLLPVESVGTLAVDELVANEETGNGE
jgi:hypothetical protein